MFYYLSGKIALLEANLAVIDCGGVGYACRTTSYTLSKLSIGTEAKLYTHMSVREDALDLYGFSSTEELNCFRMLIGVSGVGPTAALAILSSTTPSNLAMAIITENESVLTAAPRIGKKLARRIILELKDKLAKEQGGLVPSSEAYAGSGNTVIPENKLAEATAAMLVLGYSQSEITSAFQGIPMAELPLEEIIRQALRKMAN